jgi:hypothetical protein
VINLDSHLVGTGGSATLTATHGGDGPFQYRWFKNDVLIPGATADRLTINPVTLDDAGFYKVRVTNSRGPGVSVARQLAVVDTANRPMPVKENSTVKLNAPAVGKGLVYQWLRNGAPMANGDLNGRVSGVTKATLVIEKFATADEALFSCRVNLGTQQVTSGNLDVRIGDVPDIDVAGSLPTLITSGEVDWSIEELIAFVNSLPEGAPTSYLITGLPRGMSYDKTTGRIMGRPLVTGLANVRITITAINPIGRDTVTVTLPFQSLPAQAVGEFRGLVDRHAGLNQGLGGAWQMSITSLGAISGKLFHGADTSSFRGQLNATAGSGTVTAQITIPRKRSTPLALDFALDGDSGTLSGAVGDGFDSAACTAFISPWSKQNPATAFARAYTAALPIAEGQTPDPIGNEAVYPQGDSYLLARVNEAGAIVGRVRLADGTKLGFSSLLGGQGQLAFYLPAYEKTGSLHGAAQIDGAGGHMDGALSFFKAPQPAKSKTRSYKGGIPLHNLTLLGGEWTKPVAPNLVLGIVDNGTANNARLLFTGSFINAAGSYEALFRIKAPNHAVALPNPNPNKIRIKLDPASGEFNGSWEVVDDNPLEPGKKVTREADYSGVIVNRLSEGRGHFQLPVLPSSGQPNPKKTDLLSGPVLLRALP